MILTSSYAATSRRLCLMSRLLLTMSRQWFPLNRASGLSASSTTLPAIFSTRIGPSTARPPLFLSRQTETGNLVIFVFEN